VKLARNLRLSRNALLRHRVRTLLALAGTTVGVGTVLVMIAIGQGAEAQVVAQIEALGRNMLIVNAGDAPRPVTRPRTAQKVTTLRLADVAPLLERSPSIALAAPAQNQPRRVKYGTTNMRTTIRATTPEWALIRDFDLTAGRFFTQEENAAGARVGVIGASVRETLFPDTDPLGRIVRVGLVPIEIVGVLESKGATVDGRSDEDDQLVVPLTTGLRRIFNVDELSMIYVQVASADRLESAAAEMRRVLRDRHRMNELNRDDDFTIQNQATVLEAERRSVESFQRMINGLGAVALLLGGVGILAIMLLSVKERTGEVGLRMAVGARRRDIQIQFLAEALALGAAGGAAGTTAGVAVAWIVGRSTEWPTTVSVPSLALALGSALAIGVLVGVIPANRAASLDPIQALRAE
jgi:putative ABC transport system permease protein